MRFGIALPIYLSEFTARFCSWTIYSQLALRLLHHHLTFERAGLITGAVLSLAYLCVFLGGFVKDKVLTDKQCVVLGMLLIFLGSNLLLGPIDLFYPSLSIVSLGLGLVVPNLPLILSDNLGPQNPLKRETSFMIFYGFTNGGAILGPLLAGWLSMWWGWHSVAWLNDCMLLVWGLLLFVGDWWASLRRISLKHYVLFTMGVMVVVLTGSAYLTFHYLRDYFVTVLLTSYTVFFVYVIWQHQELHNSIFGCFILMALPMVYFTGEFQVLSSLTTFFNEFGHLSAHGFIIPTSVFVAMESLFVLIATVLLYQLPKLQAQSLYLKAAIGLLLASMGYIALLLSSIHVGLRSINMSWFVLVMALLGTGEVFLVPGVISKLTALAPKPYLGRLMSGVYMSLALSGTASGAISLVVKHVFATEDPLSIYHLGFVLSALLLFIVAVILVVGRSRINFFIAEYK